VDALQQQDIPSLNPTAVRWVGCAIVLRWEVARPHSATLSLGFFGGAAPVPWPPAVDPAPSTRLLPALLHPPADEIEPLRQARSTSSSS